VGRRTRPCDRSTRNCANNRASPSSVDRRALSKERGQS